MGKTYDNVIQDHDALTEDSAHDRKAFKGWLPQNVRPKIFENVKSKLHNFDILLKEFKHFFQWMTNEDVPVSTQSITVSSGKLRW